MSVAWHKGKHGWKRHDSYPLHAHSINGVLTIDPMDSSPNFGRSRALNEDEIRDRISQIVDEVSADMDASYMIDRQGKPVAVLIGFEAYRHLCTVLKHWEFMK